MSNINDPLSNYVHFYLILNPRRRKIFQYLRWYQKRYPEKIFPKMSNIAKFAGLSERAVQKFFEKLEKDGLKDSYFRIAKRFRANGSQSTNEYMLNNNFKQALEWLALYGYLNAPKKCTHGIVSSMKKEEKVHPTPLKKFTPLSKDSSFSKEKDTVSESVPINRHLEGIKIAQQVKISATQIGSEYEIQEALRACVWRRDHGGVKSPTLYFWGAFKKIVKRTRGINL